MGRHAVGVSPAVLPPSAYCRRPIQRRRLALRGQRTGSSMPCSTVIRVEHLCCGMEAKLIREILAPLEAVVDVKISLTDRRVNVEHRDELAPETIVDMLNDKYLGASLQDRSVVEAVGGSFNRMEMARLTVNSTQLVLLVSSP